MLNKFSLKMAVIIAAIQSTIAIAAQSMPPTIVEVAQIKSNPYTQHITTSGSMRASKGIMVRSEVDGRITQINFSAGENVSTGTGLIQLNQDILQARLAQHKAELKLAEQDYDRKSRLYKTHTIAKSDLDTSFATLASKQALVEESAASLRQTVISAPFSGRIGLNLVNLGDYITAGQDLVSLQTVSPIDVEFSVPEVYISKFAIGNSVSCHSEAYPNQVFTGQIDAIDSAVNQKTRSITVRAKIANTDNKLLPGMFAEVTLTLSQKKPVILIPQNAVVYDETDTFVYKLMQNKAIKINVTLGDRDKQNVAILSGLNDGDVIITAGQLKLSDGAPVIIPPAQGKK